VRGEDIMESVVKYFRDHKEIPYEDWKTFLDEDLSVEEDMYCWQLDFAYKEEEVNGHIYYLLYEDHYDTAKELINEMIDYDDCELLEAISQFSERECQMMLKYIPRARIEAEYFVLEEKER
jgi:hypothetical protein